VIGPDLSDCRCSVLPAASLLPPPVLRMSVLWLPSVIIGTACVLALFVLVRYNALLRSRSRVHEAWSAVDVQLRCRSRLIANVVEAVRGYAAH